MPRRSIHKAVADADQMIRLRKASLQGKIGPKDLASLLCVGYGGSVNLTWGNHLDRIGRGELGQTHRQGFANTFAKGTAGWIVTTAVKGNTAKNFLLSVGVGFTQR